MNDGARSIEKIPGDATKAAIIVFLLSGPGAVELLFGSRIHLSIFQR